MKPFYDHSPNLQGLKERLEELKKNIFDRALLTKEIRNQHADSPLTEAQERNLNALESGNGYTVCTGHQLCLMTGPAYVIYKICSVIALSRSLEKEWNNDVKVIPLFWLASEDHDIEEIASFSIFNKTLSFKNSYEGAAGRMPLNGMDELLGELAQVLGDSAEALELIGIIKGAYLGKKDLAHASAAFINSLFADHGLLILDADRKALKLNFAPLMEKELKDCFVEKSLTSTLKMLENRGEKIQASPREVNLFYLDQGLRTRIVKEDGEFHTVEGEHHWNEERILNEVQHYPERFSPNVLMRPLYQETLLPNLAYVGGPGELSYWLELKEMFHAAGVTMPVAVLRDSFLPVDKRSEEKWKALGFELKDLFRTEDDLHKTYAMEHGAEEVDLIHEKEKLIHHFDKLIEKSLLVDPSLAQFAKGEKARLENAVDTLEKKMVRAEKKKHSDALGRISQVRNKFLPEGVLLERKENFIPLWMKLTDRLIPTLIAKADPLNPGLKIFRID